MDKIKLVQVYSDTVWNDKNLSKIDQYLSQDIIIHSPIEQLSGIESMLDIIAKWHRAFPNITVEWKEFIADGDKVVSQWTASATHSGDFLSISPTGKKVCYNGVTIYKFSGEKIIEYWAYVDMLNIKNQIQ